MRMARFEDFFGLISFFKSISWAGSHLFKSEIINLPSNDPENSLSVNE